jgi:mannose-6-phosphate isomerase
MGLSINSPQRNYRDENHKPELLCALTPFWALKGFRDAGEREALFEIVNFFDIAEAVFKERMLSYDLQSIFAAILSAYRKRQAILVKEVVNAAEKAGGGHLALSWVIALGRSFPGDIGVLAPLVLNLIQLEPGEAIFVPAGELHAYLKGAAIEVMANSDNVLRGGLTSKHVDIQQLLKIVQFKENCQKPIKLVQGEGAEWVYPASADEFILSKIEIEEGISFQSSEKRNVEILIMVEGEAIITDLGSQGTLRLPQGTSVLVPAAVSKYLITGNGRIYKSSVPQE